MVSGSVYMPYGGNAHVGFFKIAWTFILVQHMDSTYIYNQHIQFWAKSDAYKVPNSLCNVSISASFSYDSLLLFFLILWDIYSLYNI